MSLTVINRHNLPSNVTLDTRDKIMDTITVNSKIKRSLLLSPIALFDSVILPTLTHHLHSFAHHHPPFKGLDIIVETAFPHPIILAVKRLKVLQQLKY